MLRRRRAPAGFRPGEEFRLRARTRRSECRRGIFEATITRQPSRQIGSSSARDEFAAEERSSEMRQPGSFEVTHARSIRESSAADHIATSNELRVKPMISTPEQPRRDDWRARARFPIAKTAGFEFFKRVAANRETHARTARSQRSHSSGLPFVAVSRPKGCGRSSGR